MNDIVPEYETPRREEVDLRAYRAMFFLGLLLFFAGYAWMFFDDRFGWAIPVGEVTVAAGAFMIAAGWAMSFVALSWPRKKK